MEESTANESPQYVMHKIYVKDVSFENPGAPGVFQGEWSPEIEFNCQTRGSRVSDNLYEVVLTATVTAKRDEATAFLAEVQQAGVFEIAIQDETKLRHLLSVVCPSVIYPFAREAISDLVTKGGFPQLLLSVVDFEGVYRAQLEGEA